MEGVALFIAVAVSVVLARLVVRGWLGHRVDTDRAALLFATTLPAALLVWSGVRGQLHPVLVVVALVLGVVGFL